MNIDHFLAISLLTTPALVAVWALVVAGYLGLALHVCLPGRVGPGAARRWWIRVVPACSAIAVILTAVGAFLVERVFKPFPDALPLTVYSWIAVALFAVLLGAEAIIRGWATRGSWRVAAAVLAALLVVVGACGHVNRMYAEYPTVGVLLGVPEHRSVALVEVTRTSDDTVGENLPLGTSLEDVWDPPADMPTSGAVTEAVIPGVVSGFVARPAQIYAPPAYFAHPRPLLPVLVLLAGQPGAPSDWVDSGRLAVIADAFAAQHSGLAPVVVVADPIGEPLGDTLCVDSNQGNARTYLTKDVPNWIRQNLQINTGPLAMAIGGLSFGGTCAVQVALSDPTSYPTFLDISGPGELSIGSRSATVEQFFGGDEAAYRENNPTDILETRQFPGLAGAFVYGDADSQYSPGVRDLYKSALSAGIDAHLSELPGGHSFAVWSAGLETQLPWLAQRTGLIR